MSITGPKKRFYRGLEISYSRGPKRGQEGSRRDSIKDWRFHIQEGPRRNSIEDWRFHIQEGPRGPKRAQEEIQ